MILIDLCVTTSHRSLSPLTIKSADADRAQAMNLVVHPLPPPVYPEPFCWVFPYIFFDKTRKSRCIRSKSFVFIISRREFYLWVELDSMSMIFSVDKNRKNRCAGFSGNEGRNFCCPRTPSEKIYYVSFFRDNRLIHEDAYAFIIFETLHNRLEGALLVNNAVAVFLSCPFDEIVDEGVVDRSRDNGERGKLC